MNDYTNGYSNGNGNGKQKSFDIVPPKSPEEIHRESILRSLPELRRKCSQDKRLSKWVGAKWLYCQLTDLSFLRNYGGDTHGRIYLSVKDLSRIYNHDEATIAKWRDILIETGWIWFQNKWPVSCWGIAGVTQQPELFPTHSDYIRTVASASADNPDGSGRPPQNEKSENFGQFNGNGRVHHPNGSGQPPEAFGSSTRSVQVDHPNGSGQKLADHPAHHPNGSGSTPEALGQSTGTVPVSQPEAVGCIRETPIGDRSIGDDKGVVEPASPPSLGLDLSFKKWCASLDKMYLREWDKIKADLTERRKMLEPGSPDHDDLSNRIQALDERIYGRPLPKKQKAASKPQRPARAQEPSELSDAELLDGAQYLQSSGQAHLMTDRQRELLAKSPARPVAFARR